MPIKVDTTKAEAKIRKAIDALSPAQRKQLFKSAANSLLRDMNARVQGKGWGTNGKPMKPYSKKYEKWKREHGKGKQTGYRNLTLTGMMLGRRIVRKFTDTYATIGWRDSAEALKAAGNEAIARWIKPTKREIASVKAFFRKAIKRGVKTGKSS